MLLGAYTPDANDSWTVLTGNSVTGSFASITDGWSYSIVGGNSVVLTYTGGSTPAPHVGDTDNDGDVDIFDYLNLTGAYGTTSGATWAMGDSDADGDVDIFDYLNLTGEYGWSNSGGANVPEPATMSLLALGGLVLLRPQANDMSTICRLKIKVSLYEGEATMRVTALVLVVALASTAALALDKTWNTTTGDWATGTNWTPNGVPTNTERAYIGGAAAGTMATISTGSQFAYEVRVANDANSKGSLQVTGGTLTVGEAADNEVGLGIGVQGTGTLLQTGGTINVRTSNTGWPDVQCFEHRQRVERHGLLPDG